MNHVPRIKLCKAINCNTPVIGPHSYCPRCAEEITAMQQQQIEPYPAYLDRLSVFVALSLGFAAFVVVTWGLM